MRRLEGGGLVRQAEVPQKAAALLDTFHQMNGRGAAAGTLPSWLASYFLHASLVFAAADYSFKQCVSSIREQEIRESLPDASAPELHVIQKNLALRLLTEVVRHSCEMKDSEAAAKAKLSNMCSELTPGTTGSLLKMLEAIACILNDRLPGAHKVTEAFFVCVRCVVYGRIASRRCDALRACYYLFRCLTLCTRRCAC